MMKIATYIRIEIHYVCDMSPESPFSTVIKGLEYIFILIFELTPIFPRVLCDAIGPYKWEANEMKDHRRKQVRGQCLHASNASSRASFTTAGRVQLR